MLGKLQIVSFYIQHKIHELIMNYNKLLKKLNNSLQKSLMYQLNLESLNK